MDLSLKGSQINLAIREKPKPKEKYLLQTSLLSTTTTTRNQLGWRRPHSANIFEKSTRSLWRIRRPLSADSKYYSTTFSREEFYVQEEDFANLKLNKKCRKRGQSISSSSSLLKLLLEEPIKRPWLCKEPLTISDASKSDLSGRVSFCKIQQSDEEVSDRDSSINESNNINKLDESISAPGPIEIKNYNFTTNENGYGFDKESTALNLKKSVHFGGTKNGEEILAETYEYPKCPSENCSCSTGSSSNSSQQDCASPKCVCNSTICKYTNAARPSIEAAKKSTQNSLSNEDENQVIRDYKNVISSVVQNSVVKSLYDHKNSKTTNCKPLELPTYLSKYSHGGKEISEAMEKPNNLTELPKMELTKKDLLKMDNKLTCKPCTSPNNNVINNYLKVVASSSTVTKKKENNHKTVEVNKYKDKDRDKEKEKDKDKDRDRDTENSKKCCIKTKANANGAITKASCNMKQSKNFGNLRQDSNLDGFDLDKVDSWMSMNETIETKSKPILRLNETFEKFTQETLECMKSLDNDVHNENEIEEKIEKDKDEFKDDSQDDSTYDEIVSVIKEIDEDKKKDNYAESIDTELDLKFGSTSSLTTARNPPNSHGYVRNPDKYQDIISYLDNVEDSCEKTLLETRSSIPDTNRSEIEFIIEPDIVEDIPKLSDLLMLPNHQLARRVVGLSLRANELNNALLLSKEHVMKIRTEKQKTLRAEKANSAHRLKEQKKHYEAIVERHQGFIEQLLKDKGSLCEKVAALTRRLESQNQAWEHKLETEVNRVRENTLAAEKIRRERWVRENTKKIKELTVKGLEAEINRMTAEHQSEITELKRDHQQKLLDALEEARAKHEQIETTIRETCVQDRETIIAKERNAIRERFEKQLIEERRSFDEQKQKLINDFQQEREQLWNDLKAKDTDFQTKRLDWQKEKEEELQQALAELRDKMSKQEEKYQNRLNTIEKQYEADYELWKKEYANECKLEQVERENGIRQHYRMERDRQIDAIVQRMDAEALKHNEEFEHKYSRLKEKYEKDLKELDSVEKTLREKYAETRNKLAESDAQARNFQAELKQLEMELEHSKKMCTEFLNEREQLRDQLKGELQNEIQSLKSERDQEIQQIHKRVQQAIEKKDATIDILHKENGTLRGRCLKLEAIIRQQRKDYCVK